MLSNRSGEGLQWHKVLGAVMIGSALMLAIDPDYPLPPQSSSPRASSRPATLPSLRGPELLAPLGGCPAAGPLEFRWQWTSARVAWRIVVLDDEWQPLLETMVGAPDCEPGSQPRSLVLSAILRAQLPEHAPLHWRIEGQLGPRIVQSGVAPFELQR